MIEDFISDLVYNDIQLIFSEDDHHVSTSCQGPSPLWVQTKIRRKNTGLLTSIDVVMINMAARGNSHWELSESKRLQLLVYNFHFYIVLSKWGTMGNHIGQ